jgi:phosphoribosylformylglycinamidine synthase subunit PurS
MGFGLRLRGRKRRRFNAELAESPEFAEKSGGPENCKDCGGVDILMGMKAHVWVMPKRTVLDPQGKTIHHALSSLGYEQVSDVRQGKFFVLNLDGWNRDEAHAQVERISKEVLANPVIEEFRFEIVE